MHKIFSLRRCYLWSPLMICAILQHEVMVAILQEDLKVEVWHAELLSQSEDMDHWVDSLTRTSAIRHEVCPLSSPCHIACPFHTPCSLCHVRYDLYCPQIHSMYCLFQCPVLHLIFRVISYVECPSPCPMSHYMASVLRSCVTCPVLDGHAAWHPHQLIACPCRLVQCTSFAAAGVSQNNMQAKFIGTNVVVSQGCHTCEIHFRIEAGH